MSFAQVTLKRVQFATPKVPLWVLHAMTLDPNIPTGYCETTTTGYGTMKILQPSSGLHTALLGYSPRILCNLNNTLKYCATPQPSKGLHLAPLRPTPTSQKKLHSPHSPLDPVLLCSPQDTVQLPKPLWYRMAPLGCCNAHSPIGYHATPTVYCTTQCMESHWGNCTAP